MQIIGRRRFTISNVFEPALPPFDHPLMEPLVNPEGVDPDLQTIIDFIPEGIGHSKLYISADVEFIEPHTESSLDQQKLLQSLVENVLNRIGSLLKIDGDMLFDWVKSSPIMEVIDGNPNSAYSVASLLVDDIESRQLILECTGIDSVISELTMMFSTFGEEE